MKSIQRLCHSWVVTAVLCAIVCLGTIAGWTAIHAARTRPARQASTIAHGAGFGDHFHDGTPDFLRLDTPADRDAFRRWFTWLAERQAVLPPQLRAREIADCAALLRYAYAGALHRHDDAWLATTGVEQVPALPSISKYAHPGTPLGPNFFRIQAGAFQESDIGDGTFAQFADAKTLLGANTHLIGRDTALARPGDLLFFRQLAQLSSFHSMIFVGRSHFAARGASGDDWLVYHTGPIGSGPGEMRRVRLAELRRHPDPRWWPVPENTNFLGIFRWNILREAD